MALVVQLAWIMSACITFCTVLPAAGQTQQNVPLDGTIHSYQQGLPSLYFVFDVKPSLCSPAGGYFELSKSGWKLFGFRKISVFVEQRHGALDRYVDLIDDGSCTIRLSILKRQKIGDQWHVSSAAPAQSGDLTELQKKWLPGGPYKSSHFFNFFFAQGEDCPMGHGDFTDHGGALMLNFGSRYFVGSVRREREDPFSWQYEVRTSTCAYVVSAEMFRIADGVWLPVRTRDPSFGEGR